MARARKRLKVAAPAESAVTLAPAPANETARSRAILGKVQQLQGELEGARRLAHDAQVRESLTRTQLTVALHESLAARAELESEARARAVAAYNAARPPTSRRVGRIVRTIDRLLAQLGSLGQALVIARSGVWRSSGRPLRDFRHMAAYVRRRANPDVAPRAPLDQAWYLDRHPDVAARRLAPLVHYLIAGGREGRAPHALFHPAWYAREHAAALAATSMTPLEHYVRTGARNAPHPLFDVGHYLSRAPALEAGDDPLSHYLREGWAMGLSPHPVFDPQWYVRQAPAAAHGPPLSHYLTSGWREGLSPHPLFDVRWYLEQYPDVAAAGVEPLTHFLSDGGRAGLNPGPWFDTPHYVEARGASLAVDANPLVDYLQGGAWAVADARPGFPTAAYLAKWPELARGGVTPLEHWARLASR
ncbi:MAG TPA: hypothetical protein VGD44_05165 [Phenylobacterium sp.]